MHNYILYAHREQIVKQESIPNIEYYYEVHDLILKINQERIIVITLEKRSYTKADMMNIYFICLESSSNFLPLQI